MPCRPPSLWPGFQPRWARTAVLLLDPRCPSSSRRAPQAPAPHDAPTCSTGAMRPPFLPLCLLTEVAPALAPPGTSAVVLWPHVHRPLSLQRPPMSTSRPLCGAPLVGAPRIPASAAAGPSTPGAAETLLTLWPSRHPVCGWHACQAPRAPALLPRESGLVSFCHMLSPHCLLSERSLRGTAWIRDEGLRGDSLPPSERMVGGGRTTKGRRAVARSGHSRHSHSTVTSLAPSQVLGRNGVCASVSLM